MSCPRYPALSRRLLSLTAWLLVVLLPRVHQNGMSVPTVVRLPHLSNLEIDEFSSVLEGGHMLLWYVGETDSH